MKNPLTFEELEQAWSRQLVVGQPVSVEMVQHTLVREVRERSRPVRRIMAVAAFVFVTGWAVAAIAHYTGIKHQDAASLTYLCLGLGFDVVFFMLGFRALRRNRHEAARMGESLIAAVDGALQAVVAQMRDCRLLAAGVALACAASVTFIVLKHAWGLFPTRGLVLSLIVNLSLTAGVLLTIRQHYVDRLRPREASLREQWRQLHESD